RILQLAAASSMKPRGYIIGNGDVLTVDVFEVPELSRDVLVNESGVISIPLLPVKVQAAGLSLFQLQDKLAELLKANGLISNPQVTVRLKEMHSEPITVSGAVKVPTVVQAVRPMSLLEVLSAAGGVATDAGGDVIVSRPTTPDGSGGPATIRVGL